MQATRIHGGMVALAGVGCLIVGPSGSGKSRLMAELMALGAKLVADDQVELTEQAGMPMASAPKELAGLMELRGMGLVRVADFMSRHVVHLAVALGQDSGERLPEPATMDVLGHAVPLLYAPQGVSAAMLVLYMKAMQEGRILPPDWRPGV